MFKRGLIFVLIIFLMAWVYALGFSDVTQSDFNNGTYVNTNHNGTGVVLYGSNLTGSFTSRVFDATSIARWDNLSVYNLTPSLDSLYVVDAASDFWRSVDRGMTWDLVKDDYNAGDANGGNDLERNLTNLFIVINQKLWISLDKGINWTNINSDYNGAEGQNADVLGIDGSNYIYVIEGDQDVWRSTNGGLNFSKLVSNFNAGSGVAAGLVINNSGAIFVVDVSADVWVSLDQGLSWLIVKNDFNGAIGNSADDLVVDSNNNFYILDRQDFWKSTDNGVNWTLVNDDINGASDTNDGLVSYVDSNNNLFVIDGSEDVLESIDGGVSFTKVNNTNFNNANGNVLGMTSLLLNSVLSFQARNCSLSDCSDGTWQNANLNNMNLTGRYFQYRSNLTSQQAGLTPIIYNASIGYAILDNTPPQFSSFVESPANNSAYVYGQTYKFNSTITDSTAVGSVWIDFNGTNYTSNIASSGNIYTFSKTDLAVGTYTYKWWANDSFGNLNSSSMIIYVVGLGNPSLNMNIIGTTPIIYGNVSNFSGVETNNGDVGCVYSLNPGNQVYGVGNWTFNYSTSGCVNYTSGSFIKYLIVDKATPSMSVAGTTPIVFGTATDINATETNNGDSDLSYLLYRNGNLLGGSSDLSVLGAGNYTYMYTTSGGQNYTSRGVIFDLSVSRQSSTTSLVFDKTSPQTFGTTINASCSTNSPEGTLKLYRNETEITSENNQDILLSVGTYFYICNVSESQNYSSASFSDLFVIEKVAGDVRLYLNGLENNLTIWSIQESNITATTLYGNLTIYLNGSNITSENGLNVTRLAGYYNVTAISSGDSNHSLAMITRWLNITEDTTPPSMAIIAPSDGNIYGYDQNISLDFTVSDENLQSCWYNLDHGANVTILNCQNTNFSVAGTANYTLSLYSNDSYGNEEGIVVNFSVQLDAPTITLSFPKNVYLNYTNVNFTYTPGDLDLQNCELWGNFSGIFELNQTNSAPLNYSENTFNLNLLNGAYLWNVRCSDNNGHSAFDGNKVFSVDTIAPFVSLSDPLGVKSSRTVSASWIVLDNSPISCKYNVYRGQNVEISNTSVGCGLNSTTFNLTLDADFTFNFYINDSAGNLNYTSSSFSVSTTQQQNNGGGSSSGGGSSGGAGIAKKIGLEAGKISDLTISKGGVKKVNSWKVKNTGTSFLNDCKFKSFDTLSGWIPYTESKGLAAGEEYEFVFDVNIPENVDAGEYKLQVFLDCNEINRTGEFVIEILGKQLEFTITNVERQGNDKVNIGYTLENLVDSDQNVNLQFLLFDSDKKQVAEVTKEVLISANGKQDFETVMPIDENLQGELSLLINVNSETYSTFVQENILLGKTIGGFAIFGNAGTRDKMISGLIVLLFLGFAFMMIRKIRTHHKIIKHTHLKKKYEFLYNPSF